MEGKKNQKKNKNQQKSNTKTSGFSSQQQKHNQPEDNTREFRSQAGSFGRDDKQQTSTVSKKLDKLTLTGPENTPQMTSGWGQIPVSSDTVVKKHISSQSIASDKQEPKGTTTSTVRSDKSAMIDVEKAQMPDLWIKKSTISDKTVQQQQEQQPRQKQAWKDKGKKSASSQNIASDKQESKGATTSTMGLDKPSMIGIEKEQMPNTGIKKPTSSDKPVQQQQEQQPRQKQPWKDKGKKCASSQNIQSDKQEPKGATTSTVGLDKPSMIGTEKEQMPNTGIKKPTSSDKPAQQQQEQQPRQKQAWKDKGKKSASSQNIASDVQVPISSISASTASFDSTRHVTSEKSLEMMTMEGQGTLGEKITIETNHLPINIENLIDSAHHYIFEMDPDKPKRLTKQVFQAFYKKNFAKYALAFDGVLNIYTPNKLPLPNDNFTEEIIINDEENKREKTFKIILRKTKETIDFKPIKNYKISKSSDQIKALQCLNIILNSPLYEQFVSGKRTFFCRPNNPPSLGEGSELCVGLFQSVIIGSRPYLNVDVVNKQFPKAINCIDFIKECVEKSRNCQLNLHEELQSNAKREISQIIKGLRVIYKVPNEQQSRSYTINDFGETSEKYRFKLPDGKEITILDYFAKMKSYKIRYPKMPTLSVGAEIKKMYVPAELCQIAPMQLTNKQSTDSQKANMIRYTAISTTERKNKIMDILRMSNHNASPILNKFGIKININFDNIPARILAPPVLKYFRRSITPRDGVWRADNFEFLKTNSVQKWAVLCLVDRIVEKNVYQFADMLIRVGKQQGVEMTEPEIRFESSRIPDNKLKNILDDYKYGKFNIVLIVIPDFVGDTYYRVKQHAELKCGVLTQCIKNKTIYNTVTRNNPTTVSQLLLKINAKLNGMNHDLAEESKIGLYKNNFMIIGADVTHPSPDQRSIPSVVGAVCSFDGIKYHGTWRLQIPTKEMIVDFKTITYDFILLFKEQKRSALPEKIVYYRDGVSEGDFKNVMNIELRAMYAACASISPNYKPQITFIIVQKRHHTRFFPARNGKSIGKFNNCLPGTIVDTDIVPLSEFQFFLLSHQSIQGVGRPTKYCLLWDDSKFSINDLETLTYNLCHVFTRCNRSVSYVAPTYYAHLFAYRGRVYINGLRINLDNLEGTCKSLNIKKEIVHDFPMYFV